MPKSTDVALIRKRGEELTDDQVETLVSRMIQEARNYMKDDVEAIREENIKYYQAQKFGNEEEGRSKVVMSTLRDAVRGYMPSLLRLFFGSDTVVEFTPHGKEDEAVAKQQTDYVNHIFRSDNPGFLTTHALLKDAMYQKIGIATWDWDETTRVERMQFTGLSEEQYEILLADEDTEVDIDSTIESDDFGKMYNVTVEHTTHGRCRVMACPPEEVAWNRNAREKDDARIIVHSREVPMSDLVSAGHSWDDVEKAAGFTDTLNTADDARRVDKGANRISEDAQDPHTRPVLYHNAYVLLDVKGDAKPSIWRIEMIGDNAPKFLKKTPVSHAPFAFFSFDPEPHTIIGLDVADYTKDLQRIDSVIVRGTLDSLTNTLEPVEEVVENMVNLDDLINRELGKIVRVKQPGMMREVEHRFVGRDSLPMLEYTEGVRENRLGISKASAGLDADALQSSTKQAVAGTLRKGQEQIELVARILAETGMKQMFKGILRTVIENQDRKRVVRLNNQYVEVDPRSWDASRDVRVNVALGAGLAEERLPVLDRIAQKQEQYLQILGPTNPLTSIRQLRHTLAKMTELAGEVNVEAYWKPISQEQEQQWAQQMANQPKSDPATQALAQAETQKAQAQMLKIQTDVEIERQKLALKAQEISLKDDRERDKQASDIAFKIAELELQTGVSLTREQISARVQEIRATIDADARRDVANIQARARRQSGGTDS